jgi:hypothetical protein
MLDPSGSLEPILSDASAERFARFTEAHRGAPI